ncbi:MAG: type II secretion system protein GspG, partial [Verrucomicrobia bacterium]
MSKKRQFRLRDRAGFTLVEIMIVVGIITLLAAL